jgi:hypothetical protein
MPSSRFNVIPEVHSAADPAAARIRVPFVRPALPSWEAVGPAAAEILASGRLTKGPFVERLEQAVAARLGVRHAVAVSSCTVGLLLAYKALDLSAGSCRSRRGVGERCPVDSMDSLSRFGTVRSGGRSEPIGEVILPSFTFLAGPAALVWNNLRPVFIDVDPRTTNVTPQAVAAAEAGGEPRVPVFNLDELRRLAVRQALEFTQGHRGQAATLLGVSLNTMTRLVAESCPDVQSKSGRRRAPSPPRPR